MAPSEWMLHCSGSNVSASSTVVPSGRTMTARAAALPRASRPALETRNCTLARVPASAERVEEQGGERDGGVARTFVPDRFGARPEGPQLVQGEVRDGAEQRADRARGAGVHASDADQHREGAVVDHGRDDRSDGGAIHPSVERIAAQLPAVPIALAELAVDVEEAPQG